MNEVKMSCMCTTLRHVCAWLPIVMCYILCRVGRNVAAGMTGGLAYLLDEDDTLQPKVRLCDCQI